MLEDTLRWISTHVPEDGAGDGARRMQLVAVDAILLNEPPSVSLSRRRREAAAAEAERLRKKQEDQP